MKTEFDLKQLHQIYDAVADMPPGEDRTNLIKELSEGNSALQTEVEALLESGEEEGGFMSDPEVSPDDAEFLVAPDLKEGAVIGKYRLLEQIGEGANAIVYMVEQSEPFRRRAALKVIKAGMDTREVIARFESERQALAMMDHPNIAKVFDAGATGMGRPYFVMELVKGIFITEYCDLNKLDTAERLELFILVCQALSHAHMKGIIHRDVKPSNVLVTLHDGKPVPKVIDFGIAKATGQNFTDRTLFTRFHQFIGTPAYMSPEQAEMSGLDVDTRSDVYSLGILLYELLTGSTPFDGKKMLESGFSELQRVIRDSDPETPSTRLNTMSAEGLTAVAKSRRINPGELSHDIAGDLDWIVMKALEKDRVRRYETVGELMRDVRRHLDNEPVEAGPPSRIYRMKKFFMRNRTMSIAVGLVSFSLVAALIIASFGLIRARKDAAAARREAEKADTVIGLLDEMFYSASPDSEKGKDFRVTQLLDDFSGRIVDQLSSEPEVELTLRRTVGFAYDGLGESLQAELHLRRALELAHQIYGENSVESAELQARLGWLAHELGSSSSAIKKLESAAGIQLEELGERHPDYLRSLAYLSAVFHKTGKPEKARELAEKVIAEADEESFPDLPWVQQTLAETYRKLGQDEKADALAVKIVRQVKDGSVRQRPRTLGALRGLVEGQIKHGSLDEAEELIEVGLQTAERSLEPNHRTTLLLRVARADLARAKGDSETALKMYRDLHEIQKRTQGPEDFDTVSTLVKIAAVGLEQNKIELAGNAARDALDAAQRGYGDDDELTFRSVSELAESFIRQGRYQRAESLLQKNYKMAVGTLEPDSEILLGFMRKLGKLNQLLDRPAMAEEFYRKVLSRTQEKLGPEAPETIRAITELASFLESEKRYGEAQELAGELIRLRGSIEDFTRQANLYRERHVGSRAIEFYDKALALSIEEGGEGSERSLKLKRDLSQAYSQVNDLATSTRLVKEGLKLAAHRHGSTYHETKRFQSVLNSITKTDRIAIDRSRLAKTALDDARTKQGKTSEAAMTAWGEWVVHLMRVDPKEARRQLDAYLGTCRATYGEESGVTLRARMIEAMEVAKRGNDLEADRLYRAVIADYRRFLPLKDNRIKTVLNAYGDFLLPRDKRAEFNEVIDSWQDELAGAEWPDEGTEVLVARESMWRYLNYENNEGTLWREFGGETPTTESGLPWNIGKAPFGYGIVGEASSPLLVSGHKSHTTFYFRKAFAVNAPEEFEGLKIRLMREDGAAVFLNGKEVARDNLSRGATFNTVASNSWQVARSAYFVYLVDSSLLRPGANVIAVEVHQARPDSPDMAFDLELTGLRKESAP